MRLNYISNSVGLMLMDIGLVTFIPIAVAIYYCEWGSILPFFTAGIFSLFVGDILCRSFKRGSDALNDIKRSEALMTVSLSWLAFGVVCAIPYLFYGLSPVDSLFESVSGITTTGATILENFDYPRTIMFWRSFTQWLGGMGIIVLFVAILPQFAVAGRQMFFAETPGPTEDKFTPRIKNTASALWIVYAGLTVICTICLWLAGMPVYDSICNSMSTMSAGGFSPHPQSIGGYNSNVINWIIIIFMFIAGTSYTLQSRVLTRRRLSLFWKSEEFRTYATIVLFVSLALSGILYFEHHYSLIHSLTAGFYQMLSVSTSTGSASEDFQLWNFDAHVVLFFCLFISSCSGSAGGGLKLTRWILIFKFIKNEIYKILHPNAVVPVKIDGKVVSTDVVRQTIFFIFAFFGLWAISATFLTVIEQNLEIGLTSAITSIGDIGPGLGNVIGPMGNYSSLHSFSKIIFIFNMLVGRLEIIPFLVLFHKDFWTIKR